MPFRALCLALAIVACSRGGATRSSSTPLATSETPPTPCVGRGTVPALDEPDLTFADAALQVMRGVGGFYRAMRALERSQHRSLPGPRFRVECGDPLRARLLVGVPSAGGSNYRTVLVAFLDYRQVEMSVDGMSARQHRLQLRAGTETVLSLATQPLPGGIHRLVLVFFDDDLAPGFFGWHDIVADVYVGPNPKLSPPLAAQPTRSRPEPAVTTGDYGVPITTTPDRLQLAGNVAWRPGLRLYLSLYGSQSEADRPVAVVVLQDFEELPEVLPSRFVLAPSGRVAPLPFEPRRPLHEIEALRALVFTNPDREMVADATDGAAQAFLAIASQKVYVGR